MRYTLPMPSFVDLTLTPENAQERGYELIQDTFYDREEPYFSRVKDERYFIKNHLILGQPASRGGDYTRFGVYQKIPKRVDVENQ